ncbi:MAG: PIN domain-containing protein [Limisphaerales bacterium]
METVYIETTIVSFLVANPSRDAILAAHQQLTRQWWQHQRSAYQCLVSDETLTEAARGLTLPEICTPIELGGE